MDEQMPAMTLAEAAIGLHELYLSFINAGFTTDQAMYLVGEIVAVQAQTEVDPYAY